MDYNTNARTPFVEKEGELTFTNISTKSLPLTIGKGYLGLLLKITSTTVDGDTSQIINIEGADSPGGSEIFTYNSGTGNFGSMSLVKDGRTVIEYGPSDNAGAASILCTHYNMSKAAASSVTGGVITIDGAGYADTNTGSILVPLSPMMLLPNESPENICHSTYGSNSFTLNITPAFLGGFGDNPTTLKIEVYSVCVQTDKPSNVKYLYTESQQGRINDTFSGFNTEFKSYIYGYTSALILDNINDSPPYLTSLYTQGKYIIQDCLNTVCCLLLRLTGFQSNTFNAIPSSLDEDVSGLSLPLNIDKTLTGGIKTKQIDDTRFRVSMNPDHVGGTDSKPNIQVTQYQMRGFNE